MKIMDRFGKSEQSCHNYKYCVEYDGYFKIFQQNYA